MSNESVDSWFTSIFATLSGHEDFPSSDSEMVIAKIHNKSCNSTTLNVGSNYNFLSGQNSPKETLIPLFSSQLEMVNETSHQTSAEPMTQRKKVWGMELPIPTTSIPPRKRAKTAEEKEQRRIERILRNRAAAQSSRQRKQKEEQALRDQRTRLAVDNDDLKALLASADQANKELCLELEGLRQKQKLYEEYMGVVSSDIVPSDTARAAATSGPTSYIEPPEPSLHEQEDLLRCRNNLEVPPLTSINPSWLNWEGFPDGAEGMIDVSLWPW
ncbi:hypothetical protein HOY80DRAFT_1022684 [Tuber brumale]|nr:hypothetical protein HOY80DRAFT_1022684 [Tuber brumale]